MRTVCTGAETEAQRRDRTQARGNSLAVLWLGLLAFTAEGVGSIPGRGSEIPQAAWHGQKKVGRGECEGRRGGRKDTYPGAPQ